MTILNPALFGGLFYWSFAMFDINTMINAALAAAVNEAVQPLLERINELDRELNAMQVKAAQAPTSNGISAEQFAELFNAQWNRKVGSNDLLGRDEVAEVIRELWSDEFEGEVSDKVDRAIDDFDFEDKVHDVLRNVSVTLDV
jgi:DNA-binding transcriptional regulator YbjK